MNILITGATSGIGRQLAIDYARVTTHKVFALGRNQQELELLKQYNITPLKADVTVVTELAEVVKQFTAVATHIDLLILNAGTCEYITASEFSHEPFTRVMNVNFFGVVHCLEYFLPLLRKSAQPHLVGVASMAYYLPFSRAEAYGASKAAVNYLFESLAIDLASENITVSVVNPGFVATPLTKRNDFAMPFLVTPDKASTIIRRGIAKRKAEVCFPKRLTIPMTILSLLPRTWLRAIGRLFKK